jgi:membrane protein required for colicin V production
VTLLGANPVDVIVLVVIVISALLALMRGFVAEVLSIIGWGLAVLASLYGRSWLQPIVEGWGLPKYMALGASVAILFLGTLAITSAISYAVAKSLHASRLSAVDRSLGFLFGALRGGLLVCLLYILVSFVFQTPPGKKPEPGSLAEALQTARTGPMLASGAEFLESLAPDHDTVKKMAPSLEDLANRKPEGAQPDGEKIEVPSYGDLGKIIDRVGNPYQ